MKLMFCSDIHGSLYYAEKMAELYKNEQADKLILLGDLLYHGPRNDLPKNYQPKSVIALLNSMKDELLCVRGNCDAEVDQMVLEFPILADYMIMYFEGHMAFITHGHIHNQKNLPPLKKGDILMHGHSHLQALDDCGDYIYINPGSISIPKGDDTNSYMIYENGKFSIRDLDGNNIKELSLNS